MKTERPEFKVLYESDFGRCSAEFFKGRVYLHLRVRRWGMASMRELLAQWPRIRKEMHTLGYTSINAYNYERDADSKWQRFMRMLGFTERGRKHGLVVMEVENA